MNKPRKISDTLPSICQKLLKSVEICLSSDKNKSVQFFETRCINIGKGSPTTTRALVLDLIAVSRQSVTQLTSSLAAVGCRYFPPGPPLPSQLQIVIDFCPVVLPSRCWSTAPHAVVLTLMREHYYCVYLYMLCWLMY